MKLSYYDSERDVAPAVLDAEWADLVDLLGQFGDTPCPTPEVACVPSSKDCPHKYGSCWSPVDMAGPRLAKNVRSIHALVLDLDHLTEERVAECALLLSGLRYIAHSTHSHHPPADCALRVVVALSRPVKSAEWATFHAAAVEHLRVDADRVCKDAGRIYFLPRAPLDDRRVFETNEGEPLDVDAILRAANGAKTVRPGARLALPPELEREPVNLGTLRDEIKAAVWGKERSKEEADREIARSLRLMLEGKAFCVPGDFTEATDLPRGRDATLNRMMSIIAFAVAPLTPFAAVEAVLRPSLGWVAAPEGVEHWVKESRDMYERAAKRRAVSEQSRVERDARVKSSFENLWKRRREGSDGRSPESGAGDRSVGLDGDGDDEAAPVEDDDAWRAMLVASEQGDGYKSQASNAYVILANAPAVRGSIRWNEVTKDIEVRGGLFDDVHSGSLAAAVVNWLQVEWGVSVTERVVESQLLLVARDNPFDPIHDYLRSITWDGVERLSTWLETYCKALTLNPDGDDVAHLVREFGRRWLLGAVARALRPGCKMDTVLVFEGPQGVRKSTAFDILFGRWFSSTPILIGDKDSRMVAGTKWGCEMAELSSTRTAAVEATKAFLSQRSDTFRAPYARRVEDSPRRAVFGGTVNPEDDGRYLRDKKNRRYWPLTVSGDVDAMSFAAVRDQLWAEAVALFDAGEACADCAASFGAGWAGEGMLGRCEAHRWWFERKKAEEVEEAIASHRAEEDGSEIMADLVAEWWHTLQRKPEHVTLLEVARGIQMSVERMDRRTETVLGRAIHAAGFKKDRRRIAGERAYVYVPKSVRPAGRSALRANPLRAVAGATVRKET